MPFGFTRACLGLRAILAVPAEVDALRRDTRLLANKVDIMSNAQDQVAADIATLKTQIAAMAATYLAAGAAAQAKALADAKAAWDADDEAAWSKAHADLGGIIAAMQAGQPITPPATAENPAPAPVAAPAATPVAPATPAAPAAS